jgi:hypothetical protein
MSIFLGSLNRTIATAPTIERMLNIVENFYYSKTISLIPMNKTEYLVHNSKGVIKGVNVIKKGKRFVFQSLN